MIQPAALAALTAGCGRGLTVLCTIADAVLLAALARIAGPTGLVIAAGADPAAGGAWSAVRCEPVRSLPLRSHVVDAAVLVASADLPDVAEEVRRTLAPGGDVRVLLAERPASEEAAAALRAAGIRPRTVEAGVMLAHGP